MITLTGTSQDGKTKLLCIGLCDHHIAMLKSEGGIRLLPETHNVPEGMNIDIIYAPTEKDVLKILKSTGLITDETETAVTQSPGKGQIIGLNQPIIRELPPGDAANN